MTGPTTTTPPPKKRLRMSKHKKKDQRKIDISLESDAVFKQQEEIRIHGTKLEDKSDNDLFVLDSKKLSAQELTQSVRLSKKERYKNKQSIMDKILNPATKVKPVHKPRSKSNRAEMYQERKELKDESNVGKKPECKLTKEESGIYDLWDPEARKATMELTLPKHVDAKGRGHGVKKYTKSKNQMTTAQRRKNLKFEIEKPHPGQSYKPVTKDHQDLLRKEHNKVVEEKEKEEKLARQLAWDPENRATAKTDLEERKQGLFDEEEDWEDAVEEETTTTELVVKKIDDGIPKTQAGRNRVLAQEELMKKTRAKKAQIHRESQVYNAKRFLKELAVEDEEIDKKSKLRKEKQDAKMPRLSRSRYVEPEQELKLTEEIKPSLRELKLEGSILKDRYQSLVKRAVIEPHTVHKKKYMRKYKTKLKVKRATKRALGEKIG